MTTEALHRGGFELSQWGSSHSEILSLQDQEIRTVLDLNLDSLPMERPLGLWWVSSDEVFRIRFNSNPSGNTKRQLLCTLASIFDPIKEVWRGNFDWDDELPSVSTEKWNKWITSFEKCPQTNIHRCLAPDDGYWSRADLHVFADASESGFGPASYMWQNLESHAETSDDFASRALCCCYDLVLLLQFGKNSRSRKMEFTSTLIPSPLCDGSTRQGADPRQDANPLRSLRFTIPLLRNNGDTYQE